MEDDLLYAEELKAFDADGVANLVTACPRATRTATCSALSKLRPTRCGPCSSTLRLRTGRAPGRRTARACPLHLAGPAGDGIIYVGGIAGLTALGLLEWPIALVIAGGSVLTSADCDTVGRDLSGAVAA